MSNTKVKTSTTGYLDGLKGLKVPPRKTAKNENTETPKLSDEPVIGTTFDLEIEKIEVIKQVRVSFDEDKLIELATQIELEGQRNPLEVASKGSGKFQLITGERRYRALDLNGAKYARVTLVEMPSDLKQLIALQLTENLQRDDLKPLELAEAFNQLKALGLTQSKIADLVGKSKTWVSRHFSLIGLPDYIEVLIQDEHTADIQLIDTLRKIDEISPKVAQKLIAKIIQKKIGRKVVNDTYDLLKKNQNIPAEDLNNKSQVSDNELAQTHYNRKHLSVKPEKYAAKVQVKLTNNEKLIGHLSTNRLVQSEGGIDEEWCWVVIGNNEHVCVKTSDVKILSVSVN